MDRPCFPPDANLAKIAAGGPVEVLNTFNRFFNNQRGIFPKGCGKPQTFPISTFFPQYKMDYPQPPNPHSHRILRAFHRIHGPSYYYYPRFLSLQSKIKPAPPRALPSRENFLPSLPIKTDKKLSTPAKQVVRVGIWPSNHGRNARTGPYFRAARAAGTRKKLPRTGKFPVSKGQTEQKSILSCLDFYCRKRSL